MGYIYHLATLHVADHPATNSFSVHATITNRGVAPAYYPVSLELSYPCGSASEGGRQAFADAGLVSGLLPGQTMTAASTRVQRRSGNGEACVRLTSPRAIKPIRFAISEQDADGNVRVSV